MAKNEYSQDNDDNSSQFMLTDEQRNELKNFPLLKGYVESYIENDGCPEKLFSITDFAMFFKRLWDEGIDEIILFPEWDTEEGEEWYEDFNSGGSNSRWSVGEEYIAENFSKCVDSAIRLAKKYGDFDIHAQNLNIRRDEDDDEDEDECEDKE